MKTIRYELIGAIVWFFAFFNVERLHVPLNIAAVTYLYVPAVALTILMLPWLQRAALPLLAAVAGTVFLVIKGSMGYGLLGAALPITITEVCAVLVTVVIARRIAAQLADVEGTVESTMLGHLAGATVPFELGQTDIYREIRRARRFRRPMSLLAVSVADGPVKATFHEIVERIQRDNVFRYVTAQVARVIAEEVKDCDIVTQRDDHFVLGLPERTKDDAEALSLQLSRAVHDRLGLDVSVGLSTFPDEEITFERLLAHAELDMRADKAKTVERGNGAAAHAGEEANAASPSVEPTHAGNGAARAAEV